MILIECLCNEFRIALVRTLRAGKIPTLVGEWSPIHVVPAVVRKGMIRFISRLGIATAWNLGRIAAGAAPLGTQTSLYAACAVPV